MKYEIEKIVDFSAAHSIREAGKCSRKHGHNWEATIRVELEGELTKTGFIVDVAQIKQAAFKYDHDDLDRYFNYPSTENVAQKIADDVAQACCMYGGYGVFKVVVDLQETKNNMATAYSVIKRIKPIGVNNPQWTIIASHDPLS